MWAKLITYRLSRRKYCTEVQCIIRRIEACLLRSPNCDPRLGWGGLHLLESLASLFNEFEYFLFSTIRRALAVRKFYGEIQAVWEQNTIL